MTSLGDHCLLTVILCKKVRDLPNFIVAKPLNLWSNSIISVDYAFTFTKSLNLYVKRFLCFRVLKMEEATKQDMTLTRVHIIYFTNKSLDQPNFKIRYTSLDQQLKNNVR